MSARQQIVDMIIWYTLEAADRLAFADVMSDAIWLTAPLSFAPIPLDEATAAVLEPIEKLRTNISTPIA